MEHHEKEHRSTSTLIPHRNFNSKKKTKGNVLLLALVNEAFRDLALALHALLVATHVLLDFVALRFQLLKANGEDVKQEKNTAQLTPNI
jgi:hypothetical protein